MVGRVLYLGVIGYRVDRVFHTFVYHVVPDLKVEDLGVYHNWDDLMHDAHSKTFMYPEMYYDQLAKSYALEAVKSDRINIELFIRNNSDLITFDLINEIDNLPIDLK